MDYARQEPSSVHRESDPTPGPGLRRRPRQNVVKYAYEYWPAVACMQ
jgi:hypothetical protein